MELIPHPGVPLQDARLRALAILRNGSAPPLTTFGFLMGLYNKRGTPEERDLCHHWFRIALAEVPDDSTRAEVIRAAESGLDLDDPATRAFVDKELAPYRDSRKHPETCAAIRLQDLSIAVRRGRKVDWGKQPEGVTSGQPLRTLLRLQLQHFLQVGDKARLARLLDDTDTDVLLDRTVIGMATPGFLLLGREDEADLFKEEVRRHLYELVLSKWISPLMLGSSPLEFELLALVPEELDKIPAAYSEAMASQARKAQGLLYSTKLATARNNWTQAEQFATELIRIRPTFYHSYWLGGRAAAELGHTEQAVTWLRTFVNYAKNTLDHPEAVALLKKLQEGTSTETTNP